MPDILIRDVNDATLARLEARARGNGRSLGAELKLILEQASRAIDVATARARAEEISRRLAGRPHSDGAELLREDRSR